MEITILKDAQVGVNTLKAGTTHLVTEKVGKQLVSKKLAKATNNKESQRKGKVVEELSAKQDN